MSTAATVTWSIGGRSGTLRDGASSFSIPTGVGGAITTKGAAPSPGGSSIGCKRAGGVCMARVSIANGANARSVKVKLPAGGFRLASISVSPRSSRGAYNLTKRRYQTGGRQWSAVLNAAKANPAGAHLALTFRRSSRAGRTG